MCVCVCVCVCVSESVKSYTIFKLSIKVNLRKYFLQNNLYYCHFNEILSIIRHIISFKQSNYMNHNSLFLMGLAVTQ